EDPERAVLGSPPKGRRIDVRSADGTGLYAEAFGADDAPTVVLAHGWTENLSYWTYQIRDLVGRGLRLVAYALRGHGESEPTPARTSASHCRRSSSTTRFRA